MIIKLLSVGKTSSSHLVQGFDEYENRINKYIGFSHDIIPDPKLSGKLNIEKRKLAESKLILNKIKPAEHVILLDESGKSYNSIQFANQLQKWLNTGFKQVTFICGGPYGFASEVIKRANGNLSLSPMTFSHEMVRVFFAEQLYRAFTILNNEPYHHR